MIATSPSRVTRRVATALGLAATFAACGDPVQPTATSPAVDGPALSLAAESPAQHILLARGAGFGADLATAVSNLGGQLVFVHDKVGLALVSGLSDEAAVSLASRGDVSEVGADATFQVDVPMSAAADVTFAEDAIASVANPATASRFSWQWNMRAIGAPAAWAAGYLGDASVTVAILDSGIDYDAPDLNGLVDMARSASFIPGDDAITTAYFPWRHPMNDYNGHGTNVATQVSSKAAVHAGVSSKTTLMGVKVLGVNGKGSLGAVLGGVLYAADNGADVANMSLGGGFAKAGMGQYVALINKVFNYAKQQGMLIVVAAGNDEMNMDANGNLLKSYCDMTHVVCVSSVGPQEQDADADVFSLFSNYGSGVDIAGPGGNYRADLAVTRWIWGLGAGSWVWAYCAKHRLIVLGNGGLAYAGCQAGNRVTGMVGTSQATPHVAGTAALLVTKVGKDNPAQLKAALLKGVDDLGAPGQDPYFGAGRLNVAKALGL